MPPKPSRRRAAPNLNLILSLCALALLGAGAAGAQVYRFANRCQPVPVTALGPSAAGARAIWALAVQQVHGRIYADWAQATDREERREPRAGAPRHRARAIPCRAP